MRIISKPIITDFVAMHPDSANAFENWYQLVSRCEAENPHELKKTFGSIDVVNQYVVFDIGGNKYRLIAAIHFNTQKLFIRKIWTHKEYDKPSNQQALAGGKL